MPQECVTTEQPILVTIEDPCLGKRTKTQCVYSEQAIAVLGLPVDSTLENIIEGMLDLIVELRARIVILENA